MFLKTVCSVLDKAEVSYGIVGGYAVALHGAIRGTMDIDLVIDWDLETIKKAEQALKNIGLESRLPITAESVFRFREEYINNRNLIAWNFFSPKNPLNQVDLVITHDLADMETVSKSVDGQLVHILSRRDLIKMKRAAGRAQDIEDIKALEMLELEKK